MGTRTVSLTSINTPSPRLDNSHLAFYTTSTTLPMKRVSMPPPHPARTSALLPMSVNDSTFRSIPAQPRSALLKRTSFMQSFSHRAGKLSPMHASDATHGPANGAVTPYRRRRSRLRTPAHAQVCVGLHPFPTHQRSPRPRKTVRGAVSRPRPANAIPAHARRCTGPRFVPDPPTRCPRTQDGALGRVSFPTCQRGPCTRKTVLGAVSLWRRANTPPAHARWPAGLGLVLYTPRVRKTEQVYLNRKIP
jgi:hypothetical protein